MALEATPQKRSLLEKDGTKVDEVARNFTIPITLENDKEIKLESPVHHAEKRGVQIKTTSQLISKPPATSKLSNISTLSQPFARDISKLSTLPPAVASSNSRRNISLTSDSTLPCEDFATDTSFPQQPLLNLRGSPSEPEIDRAGHSGLTSKKKRKRRKRMKFPQNWKSMVLPRLHRYWIYIIVRPSVSFILSIVYGHSHRILSSLNGMFSRYIEGIPSYSLQRLLGPRPRPKHSYIHRER